MRQPDRLAPLVLVLVTSAGVASGCSLLVDVDGLAGPGDASVPTDGGATNDGNVDAARDASGDAGNPPDATTPDVGPDPNAHVGPNLLADSSFETDCSSFNAFQGTAASDATARTGSRSCRVCTAPQTTDYFTADSYATVGPTLGASYRAVAWVRKAPGAATPPAIGIQARTFSNPPFQAIESAYGPSPPLVVTDTWQKIETTLTTTKAAPQMDVFVGGDSVPGACFLLDDLWFEKLP